MFNPMKGVKVSGYGGGQDDGPWTELCVKEDPVCVNLLLTKSPGRYDADNAAWHVNKSTDRPTRVREVRPGVYAVDVQLPEPNPCDRCAMAGTEDYPGECCPCEEVLEHNQGRAAV